MHHASIMKTPKRLLSDAIAMTVAIAAFGLAGCASQLAQTEGSAPTTASVVKQANGETETRLACNQGVFSEECNLRIYQIMVESFVDGDAKANFGTGYGTSHHNGDLAGITASLDYIKSLGFNGIWLTPIFESVPIAGQDHWADRLDATGYYASNYFAIDPKFGSLEQAKELVAQAHAKGMYVFFDGVFGHFKNNADQYPSPSGLTVSKDGKKQSESGREANYPQDLAFFKEVATYWIKELKIDGWRLDQAYQVPVAEWQTIKAAVEQTSASVSYTNNKGETVHPLGYMVAEIWNGPEMIARTGYGSNEAPALASAFDFPVRTAMVQTLGADKEGNHGRSAKQLASAMQTSLQYPDHAMPNLMLSTHDVPRFGNMLARAKLATPDSPEYWAHYKAALSFMAAYSGPLTLLYNDEIGAHTPNFVEIVNDNCAVQGLCEDHVGRISARIEGVPTEVGDTPVVLSANEKALKAYVTQLMTLREQNPALSSGSRTHIYADDALYIDHKSAGDNHILFAINASTQPKTITLTKEAVGSAGVMTDLLTQHTVTPAADGNYTLTLQGLQSLFLRIEQLMEITHKTTVAAKVDHPMASCDLPTVNELGPIGKAIWIRGSYKGGNNFLGMPAKRKFSYKGNNIYQVIVDEPTATAFNFKFASADWSSEYAVSGSAPIEIGTIQSMSRAAGPGTESSIAIPEAGRYVYSFVTTDLGVPASIYVGQCTQ